MDDKQYDILKKQPFTAYSVDNAMSTHFPMHYHNHYELYKLTQGKCRYLIDDSVYDIQPGDLVLIPPYHIHKSNYYTATHSRCLVHVSDNNMHLYLSDVIQKTGYVYRNPYIIDEIDSLLQKIVNEFLHFDDSSSYIANGYMSIICGLLLRNKNYYVNHNSSRNAYIEQILVDLKKNYSSEVTLARTAMKYSLSAEHLARIFKKETGMTFNNYLTNLRLKKAEFLLKNSKLSVTEIAYACGFNDGNYFSTKFKKAYGMSPLQFRAQ